MLVQLDYLVALEALALLDQLDHREPLVLLAPLVTQDLLDLLVSKA